MSNEHETPPFGGELVSADVAQDVMQLTMEVGTLMQSIGDLETMDALIQEVESTTLENLDRVRLDNLRRLALVGLNTMRLSLLGNDPPEMAEMPLPFGDGTAQ